MAKTSTRGSVGSKTATAKIHDQTMQRGEGGELHQIAEGDAPLLTTAQGGPVSDDQNSLRVGPRGPLVMDGYLNRDELNREARERGYRLLTKPVKPASLSAFLAAHHVPTQLPAAD